MEETALSDTFFVRLVEQAEENSLVKDKWTAAVEINGATIMLKLDTGAKANLISERDKKNEKQATY